MKASGLMARAMPESDLETAVIECAHRHHWLVFHPAKGIMRDGSYRTNYRGDKGFPDLVLAREGEVLVVELKTAAGRLSAEQGAWLEALGGTHRVWRPEHLLSGEIEEALR